MSLLHFFHVLLQQHGRSGHVGPSKFSFQQILFLFQMYKCMCQAETVLHSACAHQLLQLGVQAFCVCEQRLLCVVPNLFQTTALNPSALDLPRISRAGDWLTSAFLMAM